MSFLLIVKIYFYGKHSENKPFYLHVWDEQGKNLLPAPFKIEDSEVINVNDWWVKDIAVYNVNITSGNIRFN